MKILNIRSKVFITVLTICFSLNSYALSKTRTQPESQTPQMWYDDGIKQLESGKYKLAAKTFDKIFFDNPGSKLTLKSEILQAYSLFLAEQYEEAIDVLDIYIKLNPNAKYTPYASYLRAMCYYVQVPNIELDIDKSKYAYDALQYVIANYPKTKYALDAALKIDFIVNNMAGKEMLIARTYSQNNNMVAAIPRYQNILANYQNTPYAEEALYRLSEACYKLGLDSEAKQYANELRRSYLGHDWQKMAANLIQ